jgi:hypothetical protein
VVWKDYLGKPAVAGDEVGIEPAVVLKTEGDLVRSTKARAGGGTKERQVKASCSTYRSCDCDYFHVVPNTVDRACTRNDCIDWIDT